MRTQRARAVWCCARRTSSCREASARYPTLGTRTNGVKQAVASPAEAGPERGPKRSAGKRDFGIRLRFTNFLRRLRMDGSFAALPVSVCLRLGGLGPEPHTQAQEPSYAATGNLFRLMN